MSFCFCSIHSVLIKMNDYRTCCGGHAFINIDDHCGIDKALTHLGRDKMDAISQTFSSAFSWMKMFEFGLKFHWSLFLRVQLTIFQHWFWLWLGADQATSHNLNQWWLFYWRIYVSPGLNELTHQGWMIHICCKLSHHWFIWWIGPCSPPSHYLNQCWLINWTL